MGSLKCVIETASTLLLLMLDVNNVTFYNTCASVWRAYPVCL